MRSELTWMEGERVRKGADEGRRLVGLGGLNIKTR